MLRLALTLVAALALVTPAQAATWSPATQPYSCPVDFAFTQAGRAIAVSGVQAGVGEEAVTGKIDAIWGELTPATVYGKTGRLPFEPVGMSVFGTDGFGAIGYVGKNATRRPPVREYALVGRLSSGARRAQRLGRNRYDYTAPLAITTARDGKAVALFGGTRGRITEFLLATNGFKRTTLIARGRSVGGPTMTGMAGGAALAGNSKGAVVVAWRNGSSVYARVRTARGTLLRAQRLGPVRTASTIVAAMSESGQATVAWTTARIQSNMFAGGEVVTAAYRAPGDRFRTRVLERIGMPTTFGENSSVQATFTGDRAVVAWTSLEAGHAVVKADVAGVGTIPVTPPGVTASMSDLATDGAGATAVAWDAGPPGHEPYLSLFLSNANAFGDPERISDHNAIFGPALAIDPVSGAIVAAGPSSPVGCWFSWRAP